MSDGELDAALPVVAGHEPEPVHGVQRAVRSEPVDSVEYVGGPSHRLLQSPATSTDEPAGKAPEGEIEQRRHGSIVADPSPSFEPLSTTC